METVAQVPTVVTPVGNNVACPAPVGYTKDTDALKLFVGQIPKTFEESQIREIMEQFGPLYEVTIIKDRAYGTHKGCAFVTYCTKQAALDAQTGLHEKRTLPGMSHPMQVKPAISETKGEQAEERRLFVGMLSKTFTESDVRNMFAPYGAVEDVSILRDADSYSKGAAFVRMAGRQQAQNAIRALHQSQTMPGASSPIVVKVADTEREKAQKKLHRAIATQGQAIGLSTIPALGLGTLASAAYYQQLIQLQQAQAGSSSSNNSFGLGTGGLAAANMMTQMGQPSGVAAAAAAAAGAPFAASQPGLGNLGSAVLSATSNHANKIDPIMQAYLGMQYSAFNQPHVAPSYAHTKQKEGGEVGPEGANLFIYHLPNDVTDNDLVQMFAPFGNVISAKVFIDKVTNLSKCFGFVSYDNPQCAQAAIQAMNGFQIGTKRLKVQLKRPKDANKPYW